MPGLPEGLVRQYEFLTFEEEDRLLSYIAGIQMGEVRIKG